MVSERFLLLLLLALLAVVMIIGTYWLLVGLSALRGQLHETRAELLATREEQDYLRQQVRQMEAALLLAQEHIRLLERVVREATGQEPPPPAVTPRPVGLRPTPAALARQIEAQFDMSEMDNLAFELGLAGTVTGETAAARSVSLVQAAARRGLSVRLVELCREARPEGGF